ncbi:nucleolar GTP-binding protein 2 [Drechslerella stenobrocha 248]|uniref:Nucleolar GTP-binding protein 2 n=1 Tax=Drechslerella stenobrocha 248 TaxID=1043628 RepID=W7HXP7_9PEZI|nr:nucleolar GTP-binding protein 2 [Drechslerella stenobrocha 248]
MGSFKKESNRRARKVEAAGGNDGMQNVRVKGENFYRDAKKVKRLSMYKEGKAQRDSQGNITRAASYQSRELPSARIEPNRKWFGNTRTISQEALSAFQAAMKEQAKDPRSVLLKRNKLPMSLIEDPDKKASNKEANKIKVETEPFSQTFGPKAQRKRPKLAAESMAALMDETEKDRTQYDDKIQDAIENGTAQDGWVQEAKEAVFSKGQSKRIWNELYKVIDSSDVILHVLDARDPLGTRCRSVEQYMSKECPHKHLVFILNKCDLIPTGVAASWVRRLSKDYPTLAFHASINNSFGKGALIAILQQFQSLHSDRKQISVGLIGYPNSGKSSIINTLRKKKVCTVAPIPGETKVWQYVTLTKKIFLIDCPGIVPPSQSDTTTDILLRGVVRAEKVENPAQYISALLDKCKIHHVERTYEIKGWKDPNQFLEILARKGGRLLKGGEPDYDGVAIMVINDFLRGKLPWFTPNETGNNGQEGSARESDGEVKRKRKADEMEDAAADDGPGEVDGEGEGEGEEEWEGLSPSEGSDGEEET